MTLPFHVHLDLPAIYSARTVPFTLAAECPPEFSGDLGPVKYAIEVFRRAASFGMFAGTNFYPASSLVDLTSIAEHTNLIQYSGGARAIDPSAFRILLNCLLRVHRCEAALSRLTILSLDHSPRYH